VSLKRNFSIGFLSSIWSALLGLAVVPLYLKYLGIEAYGLIGFFATMQAVLSLMDMGLSPTINREVARCSVAGKMREARSLLHTLAIVYWIMAGVIALCFVALAPFIADNWLQARQLSNETVTQAVALIGLVVACRWPVGLYMGALMGMQKIALTSAIGAVVGTISSLGAIAVLAFISPTIKAFFIWQACVGIGYAISMRWITWKLMGPRDDQPHVAFDDLKRIWRFSAGMSGIAITGVILMQLDKILLSRLLSLGDFGLYALAGVVANSLYIMLTPLFNALYPRMSALVASGETEKLEYLYQTGTCLFLSIFFPIAIMVGVFSDDLLRLWTSNQTLSTNLAPVVSLFLIGTALNGIMHFPYALQLAYGETKIPLKINAILISIMAPMTIILASSFGVVGGAGSWALLNFIYLLLGTWLTHRTILKGMGGQWLSGAVMLPLSIAVMAGVLGKLIHNYHYPLYIEFIAGILLVCMSFATTASTSPRLRVVVRNFQTGDKSAFWSKVN
jgi:O-antigen/teichoic acid export membrane protein